MSLEKVLIILFVVSIGVSCKKDKTKPYNYNQLGENKEFDYTNSILLNNIDSLDDGLKNIYRLKDLINTKDYSILLSQEEPFINLVSNSEKVVINSILNYGQGPNEIIGPWKLSLIVDSSLFYVYDLQLRKVLFFEVKNGEILPKNYYGKNTFFIPKNVPIINDFEFYNGYLYGVGFFPNMNRYVKISMTDSEVKYFGDLPPTSKEIPFQVYQNAYQAYISINPSTGEIVVANRNESSLTIYNRNGERKVQSYSKEFFEPDFEVGNVGGEPILATNDEYKFGFIDLDSNSENIFALYSGRARKEGKANFGHFLLIYDWEGELIDSFILDPPGYKISVDENNKLSIINRFSNEKVNFYNY